MKQYRLIKPLFYGSVLTAILVLSFQVALWSQEMNKSRPLPNVGDRALDFSLQDFDGKSFTISEMKNGKAVLLWFTNLCSGCQSKLPFMEELNKKFRNKEMEVLAVSQLGKDRETVEDVIRKNNLSVRFLYDPSGEATTLYTGGYNPGTCPLTNIFLIDKAGKISFATHYPGVSEKELTNQINELMK